VGCHYGFTRAAFLFRVSHPSFRVVFPYAAPEVRPLRLVKTEGGYEEVARPAGAQYLTREALMEVLDRNLKEASVELTTRRYNTILTGLGFPLK
jgi:hypothetical protein